MLTAVVGINWGDEGKGRMVDLLGEGYNVICRYQGGNNAGHTVVNDINNLRSAHYQLPFTKMHGCGNDYIYINCFEQAINSPESLSILLSDRHTGVGGDGVVLIMPSDIADAKMRMFNLDGSEGGMCGNAIRCIAKYVYDNGIVRKREMTIETLSGVKTLWRYFEAVLLSDEKAEKSRRCHFAIQGGSGFVRSRNLLQG